MKVEQIAELVNNITKERLGETAVLEQDLSNVVEVGDAIFDTENVENFANKLIDQIGKIVFVDRPYSGNAPSVLREGWEFGSVLEKVKSEIPIAVENDSWQLVDGESVDQFIVRKPKVSAKFFNSKTTFEVDITLMTLQVKSAFQSAQQLNSFISMLLNNVEKSITVKLDGLIMSMINSMTADTLYDAYGVTTIPAGQSKTRAINLLHLYQQEVDETLVDPQRALKTPEFIRFAVMKMQVMIPRLAQASRAFNMGGNIRFTPRELLHIVMLNDFKVAAGVYLQSDTYNKEFTELPAAETVPFWQGAGTGDSAYAFNQISKIHVSTKNVPDGLEADGVLAVMFDHDALGVWNADSRVTFAYNAKGEYTNQFYKQDAQFFNDGDENFIVFYVK